MSISIASIRSVRAGALFAVAGLMAPARAANAQTGEAWSSSRVLGLVAAARTRRQASVVDSTLQTYGADARGYVYFFLDREDTQERTLIKTDQIALRVFWKAPNFSKQRIVGLRDEKRLPTNIQYHLDHLTVVQDDFADRITLGDGDEVRAVVHPTAPGSEVVYDFLLADSVTLTLPGPTEPIRVYEVQVRPRNPEAPGFVGSVFLERGTGAIVRMSFTFTPASYVDPYIDYIRISTDNALWNGKHWLPYRQQVEIRRELPQLDLPAGSVIRGRFEISGYEFNTPIPDEFFQGRRVTALPEVSRRTFPFEQGLYEQVDEEGLGTALDLDQIRAQAVQMMGARYLSGLDVLRLHVGSASNVFRFNRAEGAFFGAGASYRLASGYVLESTAGFAFGRQRPVASVALRKDAHTDRTTLTVRWNALRDIGPIQARSDLFNSFAAVLFDTDDLDPYFATGVELSHGLPVRERLRLTLAAGRERHVAARDVLGDPDRENGYRPVRPIVEGDLWSLAATAEVPAEGFGPRGRIRADVGTFEGDAFASLVGMAGVSRQWLAHELRLAAELHAGVVSAAAPPQKLFLLGGHGTLPGYDFRSLVGNRFWLLKVEGTRALIRPWLSARAFASAGDARLSGRGVPSGWDAAPSSIPLFSAGLGLGLGWDVLQLEAGRGLNGGEWEVTLSVDRRFWGWL